jgi:tetratricopeptide (TPR) repeat protein
MTIARKYLLFSALIVLIPGGVAVGWWYYLPRLQMYRAEQAIAAGESEQALDLLRLVTREDPQNLRAHFLSAQVLRRLGKPAESQAALHRAIKLGLDESKGRREFALAETTKGFTPNAEKNLLAVLMENPEDVEVVQALAEGYKITQRWDDADHFYTRWVELRPGDLAVLYARGRSRLDALSYHKGRAQAAAADFREVLKHSPDNFDARLYLAHCLISDADIAGAQPELEICERMQPNRIEPLVGLAACAVEQRRYPDALRFLERALEIDRNSTEVLGRFGDLHLRQLQFEQAIPYYERVLRLDGRNRSAHLKLVQCFRARGDVSQANEHERILRELGDDKRPPTSGDGP